MTPESVMMMGTEAMKVALALAAPLLLVALVTGLIISILQAATQINEMTLSFIPKIIAVFIAIIIAGPWMLNLLLDYVHALSAHAGCPNEYLSWQKTNWTRYALLLQREKVHTGLS